MFKFTGFSPKANTAINCAMSQATVLGHSYVGSEHLLYGILNEGSCFAFSSLQKRGINCEFITARLLETVGRGIKSNLSPADFTPRCRRILEMAMVEARILGIGVVGIEHILLSMLKEPECYAMRFLKSSGCDCDSLSREINDSLFSDSEATAQRRPQRQTKTPSLDKYSRDLTQMARERRLDPVIGRDRELERLIQILARRTKNNPCLIGEAGVGKTAIVEGLAQRIIQGSVPDMIKMKRVVSLDLSGMVAGAKYRGDFEERIKSVLEEVVRAGSIILFVDEVHTLIGTGAAEGAIDASNIMKPQLARGEFQLIGATTTEEYRKFIEKDSALERRFQSIMVEEPNPQTAEAILFGLRDRYERFHSVMITDSAIESAVRLSVRYLPERRLPDKAIDLIDEACSKVGLSASKSEDLLLESAASSMIVPPMVSGDDVTAVLSLNTGIDAGKIGEDESVRIMHLEDELHRRVAGQDKAVSAVARAIRRNRAGLKDPQKPIGSFLFLGPTGVGKTELSKALAEALFGDEKALIRLDMSEYIESQSISKLIGSPPGYIGYDDGGQLTEKIRRRPYSVVLFDELEKANPEIFNLLLQVLDEGVLTDSQGRKVSFSNSVIIMTSNLGAEALSKGLSMGFTVSSDKMSGSEAIIAAELKRAFSPEFLNRIDEKIVFEKLDSVALGKISRKLFNELEEKLGTLGIKIDFPDDVILEAAKRGFDDSFGARPLKRTIQALIEDPLSEKIISGEIHDGDRLRCSLSDGANSGEPFIFDKLGENDMVSA